MYQYLPSEGILPSNQKQIMEQAKFAYSPLGKAFEKQTKTIEDQDKKQVDALKISKPNTQELTIKSMIPEDILSEEAKNEFNKIKEIEKTVDRQNLVNRASEYKYSFKNFKRIKTFGTDIYNSEITLKKLMKIKAIYYLKS